MPFQKGHKLAKGGDHGGGRKPDKIIRDIREYASQYREEAIDRLAYWMRTDNPKASVAASNFLLNRSDGMPAQALNLGNNDGSQIILKVVNYSDLKSAQTNGNNTAIPV